MQCSVPVLLVSVEYTGNLPASLALTKKGGSDMISIEFGMLMGCLLVFTFGTFGAKMIYLILKNKLTTIGYVLIGVCGFLALAFAYAGGHVLWGNYLVPFAHVIYITDYNTFILLCVFGSVWVGIWALFLFTAYRFGFQAFLKMLAVRMALNIAGVATVFWLGSAVLYVFLRDGS